MQALSREKASKAISVAAMAATSVLGISTANAALAEHFGKTITFIEADAQNSCIFFQRCMRCC